MFAACITGGVSTSAGNALYAQSIRKMRALSRCEVRAADAFSSTEVYAYVYLTRLTVSPEQFKLVMRENALYPDAIACGDRA